MRRALIFLGLSLSCKNIGYLSYDYVKYGKDYEVDMLSNEGYYTKFKAYNSDGKYFWEIAGEVMEINKEGEWILFNDIPFFIDPLTEISWDLKGANFSSMGSESKDEECFIVRSRITFTDTLNLYRIRRISILFCPYGIEKITLGPDSVFSKDTLKFIEDTRTFKRK